jgi:Uma2 family endonuclease
MSTAVRLLTYDDLCQTPDDGNRYEIIGGELIVSPSPNLRHQDVVGDLHVLIRAHLRSAPQPLGKVVLSPFDIRLSPHDIVVPDLLFIRQDRLDLLESGRYAMGPPDLVVEVISPSSRKSDPGAKLQPYARSGIPEYWLIDPATRQFQLFVVRAGRYEDTAPADDGRLHSEVITGFAIDPAALFAGVASPPQIAQ